MKALFISRFFISRCVDNVWTDWTAYGVIIPEVLALLASRVTPQPGQTGPSPGDLGSDLGLTTSRPQT
ncbi:hypothetical protein RRG08_016774 [Elysia crispata]|uniref:Uncharacterized protein n=1 Tax=Elysia crispata TaxID=231223 RepID=A0AAE0ZZA3_9GAST|nr:hypothetical protein RRG08_016774 [Elysia crispata]